MPFFVFLIDPILAHCKKNFNASQVKASGKKAKPYSNIKVGVWDSEAMGEQRRDSEIG